MATGRTGFKRSLCVLASAGVAGGLAYVLGNSETAAEVVREIGSLDAEFISKVLGVYAVGAGMLKALKVGDSIVGDYIEEAQNEMIDIYCKYLEIRLGWCFEFIVDTNGFCVFAIVNL